MPNARRTTPQDRDNRRSFVVTDMFPSVVTTYFAMPPSSDSGPSVSRPLSVGLSFSGHAAVTVRRDGGRMMDYSVEAASGSMTGGDALWWIDVPEPFEGVELTPSAALLASIADALRAPIATELGDIECGNDPVLWAVAARLRAHALGRRPLSDLEADHLARLLFGHLIVEHLGGRPPRRNAWPLDRARLARVTDYVDANLSRTVTNDDLAGVAAFSPFHFIGAFRAATGMTPHAFVTARRMDRARTLFQQGDLSKAQVAASVGHRNGHHFRRIYAAHFGVRA